MKKGQNSFHEPIFSFVFRKTDKKKLKIKQK